MQGIRRSDLAWIKKSPAHFKYHMEHKNEEEQTPALLFGSAAHKYVLERASFFDEYAVLPDVDRRTKAGKEAIEAFKADHSRQTWIDEDMYKTILDMRYALYENEEVREILTGNIRTEVPFTWIDGETGEICKCKADIIAEIDGMPYVIDYKTTLSCEDGAFERACRKFDYDFQVGFYLEGINLCTCEDHGFAFIAQEKNAPHLSRLYICDDGFINAGKRKFHALLRKYHECKVTDNWKGYDTEYLYAEDYE
jgi:hypothetical protein